MCNDCCKSEKVKLGFKKLHKDAIIPKYQTDGAACFDFHAVVDEEVWGGDNLNEIQIMPKEQVIIRTGLSCSIPEGYEIQIRPKSGLSAKNRLTVTNTPGTIDEDYVFPNEIKIILFNLHYEPYIIKHKQRIAQGKLSIVPKVEIFEIENVSEEDINRDRGGGFGSTGLN